MYDDDCILTAEHFGSDCYISRAGWEAIVNRLLSHRQNAEFVFARDGRILGVRTPRPVTERRWYELLRMIARDERLSRLEPFPENEE